MRTTFIIVNSDRTARVVGDASDLAKAGYLVTGSNTNPRQRAELQGQPKLAGYCGPMFGGIGVVRYESPSVYASFD